VTGAASGIGRASAVGFAARGAAVGVLDIDLQGASETAGLIVASGGRALPLEVDVGDENAVCAAVRQVVDAYGGLDFAHNNAGIPGAGLAPLAEVATADWDHVIRINLSSVFFSMKHEIPHLLARGGGAIVNTASTAGLVAVDQLPAYIASKHGVVGLSKSAALDYARHRIRVNAVCPGLTRTPMSESALGTDDAAFDAVAAQIPLGRVGKPEDIAAGVIWLCSDEAGFVTGQALSLDGGGAKISLT
jgi:NAD(P)-dependent dehydrogenase (short-subunit alcohol dehydrogenase family)